MKLRVTLALVACVLASSTLASAQMSDGEKKAAARAAYAEGADLQEKGKPAEALSRFEAAEKLYDAPTHLLRIAECQALTGKLVEASETYETLIRKTLPQGSPDAFVHAQEQGKTALSQLRQRIPTMKVGVKPDPLTLQNLQINVNEKQMPAELVGIARPVNPGSYRLTATATGWATPNVMAIEVGEKDTKVVDLTLQQGATGTGTVVVAPVGSNGTAPPPPYEQPKPPPPQSPSPMGLLLGFRAGVFVPGGDVDQTKKFENFAVAGPGFGIDGIFRLMKLLLLGATFEFAALGAPESSNFPAGTSAKVGTRTFYGGVFAGIMPNVDKVTFVADAGLGYRVLSRSVTLTTQATGQQSEASESYNGAELGINAGVSIPAGPVRIVPKAGLSFGSFSSRSCDLSGGGGTTLTGCNAGSVTTSGHTVFNVVLGLYYHLDFSKRSGSASSSPFFLNAGR